MIKQIRGEECLTLRPLWEKVFFEDSREFTDYYFKEKAVRNHAFIILPEEEAGEARAADINNENAAAMLHLSPYDMEIRTGNTFTRLEINYIVGVATDEKYRHRGYMGMLLKASIDYMYKKKQPFTFLMPASPKIYEPYQFVYIYNKKKYRVKTEIPQSPNPKAAMADLNGQKKITKLKKQEIPQLLDYVNFHLHKDYDVFTHRDAAYYNTLVKELKVQNGAVYLISEQESQEADNRIIGYFLYTREGGEEDIQEAAFGSDAFGKESGFLEEAGDKPIIMARIVDVQAMLSLLRMKPGHGEDSRNLILLTIAITDPMIMENNGIWHCRIGCKESLVQKRTEMDGAPLCSTTIDKLTSWIFGYKTPEECFIFTQGEIKDEILCQLESLKLFSNVFINEIV